MNQYNKHGYSPKLFGAARFYFKFSQSYFNYIQSFTIIIYCEYSNKLNSQYKLLNILNMVTIIKLWNATFSDINTPFTFRIQYSDTFQHRHVAAHLNFMFMYIPITCTYWIHAHITFMYLLHIHTKYMYISTTRTY